MDEKNRSILPDEEVDKVTGGFDIYPGHEPPRLIFIQSGETREHSTYSGLVWERCNNGFTPNCGPGKCSAHGTDKCVNGWYLRYHRFSY